MRRHDVSDEEWAIIAPLLPTDNHGVERVDDRRVFNDILWRFRIGLSWRDMPERHGPRTTLYNRFCRSLHGTFSRRPDDENSCSR